MFTVLYSTLLKPLPFPDPDGLVFVYDSLPAAPNAPISTSKYHLLRDSAETLSGGATSSAPVRTV